MVNLQDIPLIDHHAYHILKPEIADTLPFAANFTQATDSSILDSHLKQTLFYRRSLRDIATILNCEVTEEAIIETRQKFGLEQLTQLYFQKANIETIYLDEGLLPTETLPSQWLEKYTKVKNILRLEYLAERLMLEESNFDTFIESFHRAIDPPPLEVIAFKSIAAYRTGLDIQDHSKDEIRSSFYATQEEIKDKPPKLTDKPLIDFLLTEALDVASKYNIPVQLYTGFGESDTNLIKGNPLYLRRILSDKRFSNSAIILLQSGYPYIREAGYLASVYPQVYLDFAMNTPIVSVSGMNSCMTQLLELAPTSKILYSSGGQKIPELYYLGAKWGRKVLSNILEKAVKDGDLSVEDVDNISIAILRDNAKKLYLKTE